MTPEGAVLDSIMDYLQAEGVLAFRMNVAAVKLDDRFVRFGVVGMADILAIPTVSGLYRGYRCCWTVPLFAEVKSATGRQTAEQKSFERQVTDAGAEYAIWRSVEDCADWLRRHGVTRGKKWVKDDPAHMAHR